MVQKSNVFFFFRSFDAMQCMKIDFLKKSELMQKLIEKNLIFKLIMFSLRTRISKLSLWGFLAADRLKNISSQR